MSNSVREGFSQDVTLLYTVMSLILIPEINSPVKSKRKKRGKIIASQKVPFSVPMLFTRSAVIQKPFLSLSDKNTAVPPVLKFV